MLRGSKLSVFRRYVSKNTVINTDYKLGSADLPHDAVVFSMVQPTGKFHLGNYLGATRVWKELCEMKQPEQKLVFGVADLHAVTVPKPDANEFRQLRHEAIASILSVGVDPERASLMYQSALPEHATLHWMLSTLAPMGYLNRMTQWKSKSNLKEDREASDKEIGAVKLGLFSYPVLQAADILIYRATHVPVGDDQSQHLELTRTLAENFNKLYKTDYFPLPNTLLAPTKKILSLISPETKKMSKSDPNQDGVIYVNDTPDEITRKIRKARTDSITDRFNYDPQARPGVSNLINIVSGILQVPIQQVEEQVSKFSNYGEFKSYVTEVVVEELRQPRENFQRYMEDPSYLESVVTKGTAEAQEMTQKTINDVMKIMGFR
ncbi:tryptophan--tRNA ligase MSW1 [Nakaseomyces bracarensis]|uniref:tryptophan--tRNA ligase MSW1 n=1 Tax=Nakaseomyces bracarensis TaxID=273131 RepID=UPI003872645B